MSGFWSVWVMVLACVTAAVSLFLFVWALRMRIPTDADGTTGHVWAHGVLREAVRPLPLWWVLISVGAFVFAVAYLVLYPGFGGFGGKLGWSSQGELQRNATANAAKLEARLGPLRAVGLAQLAGRQRRGCPGSSPVPRQLRRLPRPRSAGQSRRGRARSHRCRLAVRRRPRNHPDQHPRWPQRRDAAAGRRARSQRGERRGGPM